MSNPVRNSRATSANSDIKDWTREYERKGNPAFFAAALAELRDAKPNGGEQVFIGLVGSRDLPGVALRQAQAVLRWDMRPSLWSDAFIVKPADDVNASVEGATIWGVPLHSRLPNFPRPERNGVSKGTLSLYADSTLHANVAILAVNIREGNEKKVLERLEDPNRDRGRYNFWDSLGVWQGYLWSFGTRPNPLRDGWPIPSSSFVEYCFEAIGLDMTPGANERNSAPEHIWNAARWWHDAYSTQDMTVAGYSVWRDEGCSLQSADED